MKEQRFGRERAGQEEKNALKIRCREKKIRESELTQDCTKHILKQMCVVAMFCFLNQPDHRTCSVTDACETAASTEAVNNQSPISSTVVSTATYMLPWENPRVAAAISEGRTWTYKESFYQNIEYKSTWIFSCAHLGAWHLVLKPLLPTCPRSQPNSRVVPFALGIFSIENLQQRAPCSSVAWEDMLHQSWWSIQEVRKRRQHSHV